MFLTFAIVQEKINLTKHFLFYFVLFRGKQNSMEQSLPFKPLFQIQS